MAFVRERYKNFVREHPALVSNAEQLLHWVVWNPDRFTGSEYAYEAFNAAVGLVGIYNQSILAEKDGAQPQGANWYLWLAAVEQVAVLVELRAIHMEERGKMSRYGPLTILELIKAGLRLQMWAHSASNLLVEEPAAADLGRQAQQQQLHELLDALVRLRSRYCPTGAAGALRDGGGAGNARAGTLRKGGAASKGAIKPQALHPALVDPPLQEDPQLLAYPQEVARASAVHAAAIAPLRPPCACAEAGSSYMAAAGLVQPAAPARTSSSSSGGGEGSSGGAVAGLVRVGSAAAVEAAAIAAALNVQRAASGGSACSSGRGAALHGSGSQGALQSIEEPEEPAPMGPPHSSGSGEFIHMMGEQAACGGSSGAAAGGMGAPRPVAPDSKGAKGSSGQAGMPSAVPVPAGMQRGWWGRISSLYGASDAGGGGGDGCAPGECTAANAPLRSPFDWDIDSRSFSQQLYMSNGSGSDMAPCAAAACIAIHGAGRAARGASSQRRRPSWLAGVLASVADSLGVQLDCWVLGAASGASARSPGAGVAPGDVAAELALRWQRRLGNTAMQAGELLHILRPLGYVCLLHRYGLKSWRPWLLSLAAELLSASAVQHGHSLLQTAHAASWPPTSTLYSLALLRSMTGAKWGATERQEMTTRRMQLVRYLLRSPCYEAATRKLLLRLVAGVRWVPGLRTMAGFGFDLVDNMQGYYSYVES